MRFIMLIIIFQNEQFNSNNSVGILTNRCKIKVDMKARKRNFVIINEQMYQNSPNLLAFSQQMTEQIERLAIIY